MASVDKHGVPLVVTPWWHRTVARLSVLAALLIAMYFVGRRMTWKPYFLIILQPSIFLLGSIAEWWFYGRHLKTLEGRLRECRLRICLRCGYDLREIPEEHSCPECGEPYTITNTKEQWWNWLTRRRPLAATDIQDDKRHREAMAHRKSCIRCGAELNPPGKGVCEGCANITRPKIRFFGET